MTVKDRVARSIREEQIALTRGRILDAALQLFAPWSPEMPFDRVAKRAGVSERTVYRHFRSQRDLVDAVTAHIIERSGWRPEAIGAENLAATTARSFAYFGSLLASGEHEPERPTPTIGALRSKRLATMERVVGSVTDGMDPAAARGACAVIAGMARVQFLRGMVEQWGLDGAAAGEAVEWAINVLLDDLRKTKERG